MFKIIKDHQYNEKIDKPAGIKDMTGEYFTAGWWRGSKREDIADFDRKAHTSFRIKDADGILYFEGIMPTEQVNTGEAVFEPLDWAMAYAGATTLELWDDELKAYVPVN